MPYVQMAYYYVASHHLQPIKPVNTYIFIDLLVTSGTESEIQQFW